MAELRIWRYYLPSQKGEGFAEIVLCSSGFFGAVSDWGNYAFAWRHFGPDDFRAFVMGLGESYLSSKLGPQSGRQNQFDSEKSLRSIREHIIEARRANRLTKEQAREEWKLSAVLEDDQTLVGAVRWHDATKLDDPSELLYYSPSPDLVEFCRRVMPRLAEVLRAELQAEKAAAGETEAPHA